MPKATIEEEVTRALSEYLVADFEHGPFSDTSFARAEVESDGMVSLFASESDAAWPVASFDAPQLAEWIVRSPLLNRVRAEGWFAGYDKGNLDGYFGTSKERENSPYAEFDPYREQNSEDSNG